jgi:hypothetical protein
MAFLSGVARHPEIAATLARRGYTDEEHRRGWDLLNEAGGRNLPIHPPTPTPNHVQDALAVLDQWDEPNFRLAKKALVRAFPLQHDLLFDQLQPATGLPAVLAIQTFLDRLDELEASPLREDTREQDHAALRLLATRGIDPATRQRLRALTAVARSIPLAPDPLQAEQRAQRDRLLNQALTDLHAWWDEWAEIARQDITRRSYLIALGLASRNRRPADPKPAPDDPNDD